MEEKSLIKLLRMITQKGTIAQRIEHRGQDFLIITFHGTLNRTSIRQKGGCLLKAPVLIYQAYFFNVAIIILNDMLTLLIE